MSDVGLTRLGFYRVIGKTSFQFSVFSFQGDGEDDPVEHDPPVCHATDRRAADCDRHALCIVPSHITQGDAVCGG